MREEIISKLEAHLRQIRGNADALYIKTLERVIDKLKRDELQDINLVRELQYLGFHDLAEMVKREMWA